MKKTLSINLNGRVFNIDEDAYELLDNYLRNLKSHFRKEPDSAEIIQDFESRIEELFQERIRLGYDVITIEQVETIIERMGKPEDFENENFESKEFETERKEPETKEKAKKRFYRNVDDKMLGGVCSGIAAYFGWDPLPVRIVFFVLIFFSQFFIVPVYIIFWVLMPPAITAGQKLEMRGEPVTLENIGKTVSETANKINNDGCLYSMLKFGLGIFGALIGIPILFALVIVFIVLISLLFGFSGLLFFPLDFLGFDWNIPLGIPHVIGIIALIFVLGIPLFSIVYALFSAIYALFSANKTVKPINNAVKWASLSIWIIALIVLIFSGIKLSNELWSNNSVNWDVTYNDANTANRTENLPSFSTLKIDDNLVATVKIRQGDNPKISINGNNNTIDKVKWELNNNEVLKLEMTNSIYPKNNLVIDITTPKISGISTEGLSKILLNNKIETSHLNIQVEGAGSLYADSLFTDNLNCKMEGVGKIFLNGKAQKAHLELEGAGNIDAYELKTDSLTVQLEGVGNIRCNPILFLNASLEGVGNITYKDEPQSKQISMNGVGKLKKE